MIYVLLGKSCSGKTTVLNDLIDEGYKSIITCTTRPMRPGEVNGESYEFLTPSEFCKMNDYNLMIANFEAKNGWRYGVNIQNINIEKDSVIIVEPNGYRDLIKHFGKENVFGIYLDIPLHLRIHRGLRRDDDSSEFLRRLATDHTDFESLEDEVDLVIKEVDKVEVSQIVLEVIRRGGSIYE